MTIKQIANLIPMAHGVALVRENLKASKKEVKPKDMMKLGVKNIIGVSLIKMESDLISGL